MTREPARAGAGWLALREAADAAARATDLAEEAGRQLPGSRPLRIHDLGCGTGSMVRWLAPRLPGPQHWVLHDRDTDLLRLVGTAPAGPAADGSPVTVATRAGDLTRLHPEELAGCSLVAASALLDMLTEAELQRFVDTCARPGCAVLVALSVTGRVELAPDDPLDGRVSEAFNAHQRRGSGPDRLLGPDAMTAAVAGFAGLGRDVVVRPSPWRLDARHRELATQWFTGWLAAAVEQRPELGEATRPYAERRLAELAAGELTVTVDHRDLLVRPTPAAAPGAARHG